MKKRLSRVSPVQLGIVLAVFYGLIALIIILPAGFFFGFRAAANPALSSPGFPGMAVGGFMTILFPVLYAVLGFVLGVISAAIYNLVAKITGGIEFTFRDAPEQ